jgi:DNA invertase Pin-like site-specific DNA recombinase
MIYFYMRVSTQGIRGNGREQTFDRQEQVFESHGYKLTNDNTFSDHISGSTEGDKRDGFNAMLQILKAGDTVCFTETSRFARSYINAMSMLDDLTKQYKVNVRFVSNGMELMADEQYNPYTWYTISQMLLLDEFQRRQIGFNTSNALKKKVANGEKVGRGLSVNPEQIKAIKDFAQTRTYQEIADMFGISKATVCNIVKGKN